MRRYVDLGIDSRTVDPRDLEDMIEIAGSLDYSALGIKLDPEVRFRGLEFLRRLSDRSGLDLVARVDLSPRRKARFLRDLKEYRSAFGIVAVRTVSEYMSRVVLHDDRVDLISIGSQASAKAFNASIAKLLALKHKVLEIELSGLILSRGLTRVVMLSRMRRWISLARRFGARVVVSSGAASKYLLRSPLDQASIAHILGMNISEALDSLSIVPDSIIERNRNRLDSRCISPGVRFAEVSKNACSFH